jgi:PAS domain S-box-containing protein
MGTETSPHGGTISLQSEDAQQSSFTVEEISRQRDEAFQALREREAELARIQRIGRVGGVEVDFRNGFRNRRSPEYLLIHGLPPEAASETHEQWLARIHPDDRPRALAHFLSALEGSGHDYSAEYRIVRQNDGEVRWIGVTAQIERDIQGRPLRLVGAHIDITDRMLAQERLRESEERFRLIANSAPVPIWVTKLDRERAFVNQSYQDFLGLPYEESLVFDWRKALHPDDLPRILREQVAGEGSLQPFVLEARYRRADGEWRWLRSESQPRWDPAGNHIGFIGVAHDITASKQAEQDLRRLNENLEQRIRERTARLAASESRLRAILETSNQYQALLDANGAIAYANKTALAGIQSDTIDVVGQVLWTSPWFTATPGAVDVVRNAFSTAMAGNIARCELRLQLPTGERDFDMSLRPISGPNEAISGVVVEAVDVTDRRRSEEALRQSQKMEAVGQLTGGVAHDFNNILTIIRSASDLLRRPGIAEDRRDRYINTIAETIERASKLTSQLLAFARRQPLKPQVFPVGETVLSTVDLIRPLVGTCIKTKVEIDGDDHFAIADIAQFETAIINLAVNGRDAMKGVGDLTIRIGNADQIPSLRGQPPRAGRYITISVSDGGIGIPQDKQQIIFEPFFTTKDVGKGTGLGLSQVLGFTMQSGGDIELISAPGVGATFILYLPEAATSRTAHEQDRTLSLRKTDGRPYRILLVEDNAAIGQISSELLSEIGYRVTLVTTANEAMILLTDEPDGFDAVLSDVVMPGMSGIDLAKSLKGSHPNLPVVLASGYSHVLAENADHSFSLLQKPYAASSLSTALRKAIAEKQKALESRAIDPSTTKIKTP